LNSLVNAVKHAFPKLDQPSQRISIKAAAKIIGITPPIYIRNLITTFDQIPDIKVFDNGYIATGYAVGGSMKVIVHRNGDYSFSGHWHNSSGAIVVGDTYRLGLSVSLNTHFPNFPQSYIFFKGGTTVGDPFNPHRDLIWDISGNDSRIRDNWILVGPIWRNVTLYTLL
jgi:hypothetical protein